MWTIIAVKKGPGIIDDNLRAALIIAACELSLRKIDRMKFKGDKFEGIIQTEWKTNVIGSRTGVLSNAQIDRSSGDFFVNFILNETDLKEGGDVIRALRDEGARLKAIPQTFEISVPELHEFRSLLRHKLH